MILGVTVQRVSQIVAERVALPRSGSRGTGLSRGATAPTNRR